MGDAPVAKDALKEFKFEANHVKIGGKIARNHLREPR